MKPLLLVDVDGVLNPFGRANPDYRRYECVIDDRRYVVHLNPRHGARLLELALKTGSELVWATTWVGHANEWIGPRIGLPTLPVIEMEPGNKTPYVADYVRGRPFVWFDDQVWVDDEDYLRGHQGVGDFLLVPVEPHRGLTSQHLQTAAEWLTLTGFSQGP
ncbi:MAG: hypothetical protein HOY71_29815 [Nonomuraea sp.]|nr:hypothetical protein [Nonomuraea sp.]